MALPLAPPWSKMIQPTSTLFFGGKGGVFVVPVLSRALT